MKPEREASPVVVTAHRWEFGWELRLDGAPLAQVAQLDRAEQRVRDVLRAGAAAADPDTCTVTVIPDLGELSGEVAAARRAEDEAGSVTRRADGQVRDAARRLRAAGYSVSDSATMLGVSRERCAALLRD